MGYKSYNVVMSKNNKQLVVRAGLSLILFIVLIMSTSPYRLPLLAILLPAVPLLACVIYTTRLIMSILHVRQNLWRPITYVAALVSTIFIVLLSLGQLSFKDFFLLLSLGLVAGFYMTRMFFSDDE